MPLFHGKSKEDFKHNVKQEMHEGKSVPQSLAIAYSMKKRSKKMANGGMMTNDGYQSDCTADCNSPCEVHPQAEVMEEEGPKGAMMADDDMDMVGRIMSQRQKMYSEGGKVANEDLPEADFMPNEFDDLHLRDDLESSYTGANSGDELSNDGEDERRRDMVSRIMSSRRKRAGHNPNPA